MAEITVTQIHALLTEVGRRYPLPATLTLLGGCALCLLGSTRPTLDIDYVGHDLHKNELQQVIDLVAQEMQLEVEAVPIDGFIPLPSDSLQRRLPAGDFGSISVYILLHTASHSAKLTVVLIAILPMLCFWYARVSLH
jgi:hypothetical protein